MQTGAPAFALPTRAFAKSGQQDWRRGIKPQLGGGAVQPPGLLADEPFEMRARAENHPDRLNVLARRTLPSPHQVGLCKWRVALHIQRHRSGEVSRR